MTTGTLLKGGLEKGRDRGMNCWFIWSGPKTKHLVQVIILSF